MRLLLLPIYESEFLLRRYSSRDGLRYQGYIHLRLLNNYLPSLLLVQFFQTFLFNADIHLLGSALSPNFFLCTFFQLLFFYRNKVCKTLRILHFVMFKSRLARLKVFSSLVIGLFNLTLELLYVFFLACFEWRVLLS